jgi:hypothetical protein
LVGGAVSIFTSCVPTADVLPATSVATYFTLVVPSAEMLNGDPR